MSTTTPVQIRIDVNTKKRANELFKELGTDMSGAVNMFLKQCIITDSIPLTLKRTRRSKELDEAIAEAEALANNPNAETYENFDEYQAAMQALMEEDK